MFSRQSLIITIFASSFLSAITTATTTTGPYEIHNITRSHNLKFENIAVRRDGQALATISAPAPLLYLVDPLLIRSPVLVHSFDNIEHLTGIYELSPDTFVVAGGYWTITDPALRSPQLLGLYEVDMRRFAAWPNGTVIREAGVRQVASLSKGGLLNGVASVQEYSSFVLVADTFAHVIWRVDILTGSAKVALNDSTTAGTSASPTSVNGIKIFNSTMYYTNTGQETLHKVPVTSAGRVIGPPTLVTDNLPCDDLILDSAGNAYVARPSNVITKVSPSGEKSIVAGTVNSTASKLVGATAVAFGRLATDWKSLYVTTKGGAMQVVNGTQGVSRIDVFDLPATFSERN